MIQIALTIIFVLAGCNPPRPGGECERPGSRCGVVYENRNADGEITERGYYTYEQDEKGNVTYEGYSEPGESSGMGDDFEKPSTRDDLVPFEGGDYDPPEPTEIPFPDLDDLPLPEPDLFPDPPEGYEPPEYRDNDRDSEVDDYLDSAQDSIDSTENEIDSQIDDTRNYGSGGSFLGNLILEITGINQARREKLRKERRKLKEAQRLLDETKSLIEDNKKATQEMSDILSKHANSNANDEAKRKAQEQGEKYNANVDEILDQLTPLVDELGEDLKETKSSLPTPAQEKLEKSRAYSKSARNAVGDDPVGNQLLDVADGAFVVAEQKYNTGNDAEGDTIQEIGIVLVDTALSFLPGVGWGKDIYEAASGKNLVTGDELSSFDRTFAIIGAATFGVGSKVKKAADVVDAVHDISKGLKAGDKGFDSARATIDSASSAGVSSKWQWDDALEWLGKPLKPAESGSIFGKYVPPPKVPKAFEGLTSTKRKTPSSGGGLRKRWKDSDGNIYEWDSQHGAVEKYNKKGKHLGEYNADTGVQTKPPNPSRKVEP